MLMLTVLFIIIFMVGAAQSFFSYMMMLEYKQDVQEKKFTSEYDRLHYKNKAIRWAKSGIGCLVGGFVGAILSLLI